MIEFRTEEGKSELRAEGSFEVLGADAIVFINSLYEAIRRVSPQEATSFRSIITMLISSELPWEEGQFQGIALWRKGPEK